MTNATVGTVSQTGTGGIVRVKYQGGESEYQVGPDVPVLAYVPADRSLLKPGAAVVTTASKKAGRQPHHKPGGRREGRRQAADVNAETACEPRYCPRPLGEGGARRPAHERACTARNGAALLRRRDGGSAVRAPSPGCRLATLSRAEGFTRCFAVSPACGSTAR